MLYAVSWKRMAAKYGGKIRTVVDGDTLIGGVFSTESLPQDKVIHTVLTPAGETVILHSAVRKLFTEAQIL